MYRLRPLFTVMTFTTAYGFLGQGGLHAQSALQRGGQDEMYGKAEEGASKDRGTKIALRGGAFVVVVGSGVILCNDESLFPSEDTQASTDPLPPPVGKHETHHKQPSLIHVRSLSSERRIVYRMPKYTTSLNSLPSRSLSIHGVHGYRDQTPSSSGLLPSPKKRVRFKDQVDTPKLPNK